MLNLSKEDAISVADKVVAYYSNFGRIDDYFRHKKSEKIKNIPNISIDDSIQLIDSD